ncbi:MAG TPA: corrinoid protein [Anaerolineales bacterium]|nr:corrinoid protein [Anaerolineales bacterium]
MEEILKKLFDAVLEGDFEGVKSNLQAALDAKLDPIVIMNDGMIAAMREVGCRFEEGDYYVPEMLLAARAMQSGMTILKPHLQQTDRKSSGKVVIGTVKGDLHDIGKNLVALMLEGAGFEIKDLGVDVPIEEFIRVVQEEKPDIVAMSALLTTTMQMMKQTIDAFEAAGLGDKVKFIIGGAPVTEAYASQIGADGFASDASRAVNVAKSLIGV